MTVPIGQRFPETVPAAGPAKGSAGARATDNGFSDVLQGAEQRSTRSSARQTDGADVDPAAGSEDRNDSGSSEGRAAGKAAGLSPFGAFDLQSGRHAVGGDRLDPASTRDEGKDDNDKDGGKHVAEPMPLLGAIGHAAPSAEIRDRDASGQPTGRERTDRPGKSALSAAAADADIVAAAGDMSQDPKMVKSDKQATGSPGSAEMRDPSSILSTVAVKVAGTRSSASHSPAETDHKANLASAEMPDDSLETIADATKSSHASARVAARSDHHDADGNSASNSDRFTGKDAGRRQDNAVHVVSERSFPAPAAHSASPTVASLAEVLASARGHATAGAAALQTQGATVAVPAHTMRIELHPAELGTVMASLKLSGDQLSVELKPETAEAYRHLSKESDAIASSLKKLGLDVDKITILQPSIALTPTARADAGNQASAMQGRDGSQFQQGTSGGSGNGFGGQQSGGNRGHEGQALDSAKPTHRERAGGSLFI